MTKSWLWFYCPVCQRPRMVSRWRKQFLWTRNLKFDDAVDVLLSEEVCRKSSGLVKTSGSALSVDQKERLLN